MFRLSDAFKAIRAIPQRAAQPTITRRISDQASSLEHAVSNPQNPPQVEPTPVSMQADEYVIGPTVFKLPSNTSGYPVAPLRILKELFSNFNAVMPQGFSLPNLPGVPPSSQSENTREGAKPFFILWKMQRSIPNPATMHNLPLIEVADLKKVEWISPDKVQACADRYAVAPRRAAIPKPE